LFGYGAVHGSLHDLGFGERGFVVPDATGRWVKELFDFTPARALSNLFTIASELSAIVLPAFLLVPLILIGYRIGYPARWKTVIGFLVLPALYFFYFYPHIRFYIELLPFLYVGIAGLLFISDGRTGRWPACSWCQSWRRNCCAPASRLSAAGRNGCSLPGMPPWRLCAQPNRHGASCWYLWRATAPY
jgi:hypothetical protein